jgi:hypothetical protein
MGSSQASSPRSTRVAANAAVKAFEQEPIAKPLSASARTLVS